jgi:hypothetical protein
VRSGEGKLTDADGNIYEGKWLNDKAHGQGTLYWKNGDKYEGLWAKGIQHGRGTFFSFETDYI